MGDSDDRPHQPERAMHHDYLSVSDAARQLGVQPRQISDLFYQRRLNDDACPVVGGRRLIPVSYLPAIADALRSDGGPSADQAAEGTSES
jgi:hypothetical protein